MAESREKYPELREEFNQIDRYMDLWGAAVWGIEAGRRDALEEAAKVAEAEGATPRTEGGNISRWDACDNVAAAIRALET